MTMPTINDIQAVDPVLTNMLVAFLQDSANFVAQRVFPQIPVVTDSGTYYEIDQKNTMLDQMKARAPGAQYALGGFAVSTSTYATKQWALGVPIADEIRANSQLPGDLETLAVEFLGQESLIRKERAWATDFMVINVWGTDGSVSNKWSDYAASDPVADFGTARRTISQAVGRMANTAVVGELVRDRLVNHPDLIDRVKYTEMATFAGVEQALAAILKLDSFLVASAIYNSANEGQTGSYSAIVDDDCLIMHVAPRPGLMVPSAGYTFTWAPGGGNGTIMRNRSDETDSDLVKIKEQWDQKVISAGCGYFFADCTD